MSIEDMVWQAPFVVLAVISWPCSALISTSNVEKSGITALLVADKFGVAAGGLIRFDVELEDSFPDEDFSPAYYIVVVRGSTSEWFEYLLSVPLDMSDPPPLCVAPSTARFEVTESASFNMTVVQHDIYAGYLMLCHRGDKFSGRITSTFINLDPEGDLTQHLPIQISMLPPLYALMAVVYVGFAGAWMGEMARLRQHVLPMHYLCLSCILVKAMEVILSAAYFDRQNKEGQNQDILLIARGFSSTIFLIVFLLTLLLFSLGWGFVRPSLRSKEGWLVVVTIGFYACVSLLEAGCLNSDSALCGGLSFMEYAIRSLILLSTVVAININISHIRLCIQLPWTSSSALEYLKLNRYLSFRMIFLAYLLLPTALLVVSYAILSWEYDWINYGMEEFVTMLILAHLGTTFAPFDPWLLTRAFDHSLEQENS